MMINPAKIYSTLGNPNSLVPLGVKDISSCVGMTAGSYATGKEEGFDRIAYLFTEVGKIEKEHEERYRKLLENVKDGKVFEAGEVKIWKCRNCGHIVVGTKAPEICPVCSHPQAYFEIKAENY